MNIKKLSIIFATVVLLAIGILFIASGFGKRTDVCLQDYSVSEDGSVITVQTLLAGSMGLIRDIETERNGNAIYCSFYCAFGGSTGGIGGKSRFEIKLDDTSTEIYFDRGAEGRVLVLQKDKATGTWMMM